MRQAHVTDLRDAGACRRIRRREVRRGVLGSSRQWRPLALVAPDDAVLLRQAHAIPRLDEHRDLARDEVRAPRHPAGLVALADPPVLGPPGANGKAAWRERVGQYG